MKYISKRIISLMLALITVFSCLSGMSVSAEADNGSTESATLIITIPQNYCEEDYESSVLSAAESNQTTGGDAKAAAGKVTAITVDSGNKDKSKVSCLGGSFKAVVTGTNLYNKIAVFNGNTRIGAPVLVGKAGSTDTTATIEKGKFNLPANNSNAEETYNILVFPGDMKDGDITADKGQKLATVKVESRRDAFEISATSLTYGPKGGSQDIVIRTNCALSAVVADSSWVSMAQPSGELKLRVTAGVNPGAARKTTITISTTGSSKQTATIEIAQSGLDYVYRLSGSDRIGTCAAISYYGWEKANTVIITSGVNFADALAGAPLSAAVDAPILLTMNKNNGVEKTLLDEIQRLGAKKVYILGGTVAVNATIEKNIKDKGYTVTRLYGDNRYGTAVAIAKELAKVTGRTFDKFFFTNADNYPDALSISSVAAIEGNPILYMPATGGVEKTTKEYIKNSKCRTGVVVGGNVSVSEAGYNALSQMGLSLSRVYGQDRYKTSAAINQKYASLFSGKEIAIAAGTNFPDALAGSALCAKLKMPMVLASEKSYKDAYDYIRSDAGKGVEFIYVYGGPVSLSNQLVFTLTYKE